MKRYQVTITDTVIYFVNAESEDEAIEAIEDAEVAGSDSDIDVEEINA